MPLRPDRSTALRERFEAPGSSVRDVNRRTPFLVLIVLAVVAVVVAAWFHRRGNEAGGGEEVSVVQRVIDGDTLVVANGDRVRLVQIDAPEISQGECYAVEAMRALDMLAPAGSRVRLEGDPALDDVDRFGRRLRYVWRNGVNVNLALVRKGAASVWFFDGSRGLHADTLLTVARNAERSSIGLWGACPAARLDPFRGVDTGRKPFQK